MERLESRSHQARALEWGAVVVFIAVLSWVLMARYEGLKDQALATMARYEHQILETHLQVYRIRHGDWPPDLRTMVKKADRDISLETGNSKRSTLFDDRGRMIDPYGHPYRYDPERGELKKPVPLADRKSNG